MRSVRGAASLFGACCVLMSCAPASTTPTPALAAGGSGEVDPEASRHTRGTIFTEADLVKAQRPLLDLMRQRLVGLQVRATPLCPEVMLRGRSTLVSSSSPAVYVDGLMATNTCILQDLNTANLARVEIYPDGIPGRPGYRVSPHGVILIFVRQAEIRP